MPKPKVEIDAATAWCSTHHRMVMLDPARRFGMACQRLFDYAVRDRRIQLMCGYNPETGARADPSKLTAVLREKSPLCCYLGRQVLENVLRESYPGKFEQAQAAQINIERLSGRLTDAGHAN